METERGGTAQVTRVARITRAGLLRTTGTLASGGLLVGACGLGSQGGGTARVPGGQVTISFLTDWNAGPRGQVIQDAVKLWQQKYPSITLDLRSPAATTASGPVQVQMAADMAAGTTADVALYSSTAVAAQRSAFVDVTPYLKRDKIDTKDFLTVEPDLLYQGGQYGMPFQYVMSFWMINKTLFQQSGLKPPDDKATWNDMADAARRLTVAGKSWGLEDNRGLDDWLDGWLPSNGGWYLSGDGKHTTLNTPQALEAVKWIADQNVRDKTVMQATDRQALGLNASGYQNGRVAMAHSNVATIGSAPTTPGYDQFEWDVMWTPKAPKTGKGLANVGDQPHVLPRRPSQTAPQADAGWLFMTFLSGPDVQALIAEGRGSMPVYKKILNGPRYLRTPPVSMPIVGKEAESPTFSVAWFPGYDQWYAVVRPLLLSAMRGEIAAEDALRQATTQGDAVLQQFGAK
jgi:ABC-type glycerol-3-phosphate transport system substrate-binding protein